MKLIDWWRFIASSEGRNANAMTLAQRNEMRRFTRGMWDVLYCADECPDAQLGYWDRSAKLLAQCGFLIMRPAYDRGWYFLKLTDAGRDAVAYGRRRYAKRRWYRA